MEFSLEGHGYSLGRALRMRVPGVFGAGDLLAMPERGGCVPPPELLASLHVRAPSSSTAALALPVAASIKEVFDRLRPRMDLVITHCAFDEQAPDAAHLVVGCYFPGLAADVVKGDTVAAGVMLALYGERGHGSGGARLEVLARVFRKVCENGAMIHVGDEPAVEVDARLLGADRPGWGTPPGPRPRLTVEIERRLVAARDPALFTAALTAFRAAAADPLDHRGGPHGALLRRALPYDAWQSIMARYAAEPWTRWGLANAVTAEAHAARTFTEAKRIERTGGLVARAPGHTCDALPEALLGAVEREDTVLPAASAVAPATDGEKVGTA
jgi:hypothetical protein